MVKKIIEEVDVVSTGLVIMIIGLIIILLAPDFSGFFILPTEITGYEDKTTRISYSIHPAMFIVVGIFITIIGSALFLRNFVNMAVASLITKSGKNDTS